MFLFLFVQVVEDFALFFLGGGYAGWVACFCAVFFQLWDAEHSTHWDGVGVRIFCLVFFVDVNPEFIGAIVFAAHAIEVGARLNGVGGSGSHIREIREIRGLRLRIQQKKYS